MKKVVCGDEKGYLIPKKEFEEKLKNRFKILENRKIQYIFCLKVAVKVSCYISDPKREEQGVFTATNMELNYSLIMDKKIFNDLFGIKGNVDDITLKYKEGEKFYSVFSCDELFHEDSMYYFLTEDPHGYTGNYIVELE